VRIIDILSYPNTKLLSDAKGKGQHKWLGVGIIQNSHFQKIFSLVAKFKATLYKPDSCLNQTLNKVSA
jgi:hypothetical protein